MHFSYTNETLKALERSFSTDRLETYISSEFAQGDRVKAIRLHVWNTAVCAAFYGPLQGLEVALRNAMNRRLMDRYGTKWYEVLVLAKYAEKHLDEAKMKLERKDRKSGSKHEANSHRLMGELPFGFWVSLLTRSGLAIDGSWVNYEEKLWRPALRGAFTYRDPLMRRQVQKPLSELRLLRNRIAHHEPIFTRDLKSDYDRIVEISGWISPATQKWIEHHSRVPEMLESTPDQEGIRF